MNTITLETREGPKTYQVEEVRPGKLNEGDHIIRHRRGMSTPVIVELVKVKTIKGRSYYVRWESRELTPGIDAFWTRMSSYCTLTRVIKEVTA